MTVLLFNGKDDLLESATRGVEIIRPILPTMPPERQDDLKALLALFITAIVEPETGECPELAEKVGVAHLAIQAAYKMGRDDENQVRNRNGGG